MNLNELTIRLLILFLPGMISSLAVSNLTTHRELKPADHILPSFIYGFLVHVAYNLGARSWNTRFSEVYLFPEYQLLPKSERDSEQIAVEAILYSIAVGLPFALLIAAAINHKVLNRVARALQVTRKFGDRDVWSFVMNAPGTPWVVVRDSLKSLYYLGAVDAFSDEENTRELYLRNVRVYDNDTGDELYQTAEMYFSFPRDSMVIEMPGREES